MSARKLLFYGDSPFGPTGFGRVSEGIFRELSPEWDIQIFGLNHREAFPEKPGFDSVSLKKPETAVPGFEGPDPYQQEKFLLYLSQTDFEYERLLLLHDSYVLTRRLDGPAGDNRPFIEHVTHLAHEDQARVLLYFPVDAPPAAEWVTPLFAADEVVVYTRWARRTVEATVDQPGEIEVIPHGSYTDTFYPIGENEISQIRRSLELNPDDFALGFVGVNHLRKNIPRDVMLAFAELNAQYPETTLLLKTQPVVQENGWDLVRIKEHLETEYDLEENAIRFITVDGSAYLPDAMLNQVYNALDAVYLPSMEGWGLPITEAFSTKTPTIVGDHAALSEVGGENRSLKVEVPDSPNHRISWNRDMAPFRTMIDINDFVQTAGKLVEMEPDEREALTNRAYDWIQTHTWAEIADRWRALLD